MSALFISLIMLIILVDAVIGAKMIIPAKLSTSVCKSCNLYVGLCAHKGIFWETNLQFNFLLSWQLWS